MMCKISSIDLWILQSFIKGIDDKREDMKQNSLNLKFKKFKVVILVKVMTFVEK